MLSLTLARQLKEADLVWTPAENDFFAIPDRDMDDSVFVISDMIVLLEILKGRLSVTFHGSTEWALDHIVVAELVWLPTEAQLRSLLEQHLLSEAESMLRLTSTSDGYRCEIKLGGEQLVFEAFGAAEAYATALLHILKSQAEA